MQKGTLTLFVLYDIIAQPRLRNRAASNE